MPTSYPNSIPALGTLKNLNQWVIGTSAADSDWRDVCWSPELGLFAAVAGSGTRVMTSPDGITWTSRNAGAYVWNGIAWAKELGIFCAVAQSLSRVMTSPDGITWTDYGTLPIGDNAICWSRELGLFVAVGQSGRVATSPDGINWTARTPVAATNWNDVIWSPELALFVAVGPGATGVTDAVMTSPDGINWTLRTAASNLIWQAVCWSPELGLLAAVAVNSATATIMTSPDGITWTSRNGPDANGGWQDVVWGDGTFVAVAINGSGNRTMYSTDGITWTSLANAADNSWNAVTYAPRLGIFIAVAATGIGNRVMRSQSVIILAAHTNDPNREVEAICAELGINPRAIDDTVAPGATPASVAVYHNMVANIIKNMTGVNWYKGAVPAREILAGKALGATVPAVSIQYMGHGMNNLNSALANVAMPLTFSGKLLFHTLRVEILSAQPSDGRLVFSVMVDSLQIDVIEILPSEPAGIYFSTYPIVGLSFMNFIVNQKFAIKIQNFSPTLASAQIGSWSVECNMRG